MADPFPCHPTRIVENWHRAVETKIIRYYWHWHIFFNRPRILFTCTTSTQDLTYCMFYIIDDSRTYYNYVCSVIRESERNSRLFLMCTCERLSKLPKDLLILMSNNISQFENLRENQDQKS